MKKLVRRINRLIPMIRITRPHVNFVLDHDFCPFETVVVVLGGSHLRWYPMGRKSKALDPSLPNSRSVPLCFVCRSSVGPSGDDSGDSGTCSTKGSHRDWIHYSQFKLNEKQRRNGWWEERDSEKREKRLSQILFFNIF